MESSPEPPSRERSAETESPITPLAEEEDSGNFQRQASGGPHDPIMSQASLPGVPNFVPDPQELPGAIGADETEEKHNKAQKPAPVLQHGATSAWGAGKRGVSQEYGNEEVIPLRRASTEPTDKIQRGKQKEEDLPLKTGSYLRREEGGRQGALFGDVNAMRDSGAGGKEDKAKEYNVFDYYKGEWSPVANLAKKKIFENLTLGVIAINAVWIGIDTDHNDAATLSSAKLHFVIVDNFFCFYFTGEVLIRFLAFEVKRNCMNDGWFKFDTVLVLLMVMETWLLPLVFPTGGLPINLAILRLLRLLRLTRMARLMKSVPELLTLIKGMAAATRSVGSTMILLIVFLYVFAIIFTGFLSDFSLNYNLGNIECPDWRSFPGSDCESRLADIEGNFKKNWGSMSRSMFTLFVGGTLLDDFFNVSRDLQDAYPSLLWALMLFVLLSAFTVLNMLIGVLCEVVSATAEGEKRKGVDMEVAQKLAQVFTEIDADGSGKISQAEFDVMKENEEVLQAFETMGIEPRHLISMGDTLFEMDDEELEKLAQEAKEEEGEQSSVSRTSLAAKSSRSTVQETQKELSFTEFLEIILRLRPEKGASVLDFADLKKGLRKATNRLDGMIDDLVDSMDKLEDHLSTIQQDVDEGPPQRQAIPMISSSAPPAEPQHGISPRMASKSSQGGGGPGVDGAGRRGSVTSLCGLPEADATEYEMMLRDLLQAEIRVSNALRKELASVRNRTKQLTLNGAMKVPVVATVT